jgi:hypothetical protein
VLVVAVVVLVVEVVEVLVVAVVVLVVEVVEVLVVAAVVLVVELVVVEVEVVEVLVVAAHGSGTQVPGPLLLPPAAVHSSAVRSSQVNAPPGEPGTQHWMFGAVVVVVLLVVVLVVELVVVEVEVVVLVVELVVVVVPPTGQRGRPRSPVQVQRCALHWFVMLVMQLSEGKNPHASLISSPQAMKGSHLKKLAAIAEEERKTPTPTAANNVTTAFLVIAGSPLWPFPSC